MNCKCLPGVASMVVALLALGCGGGEKPGKSLTQQFNEAMKVSDAGLRARRLVGVAEKQHKAGDLSSCTSSLAAAKEAAMSVSDAVSQANTLNLVAGGYARLDGNAEDIKSLLKESAKAIERIEDAGAKVQPLAELAAATSVHLKNKDAALSHLKSAEDAAAQIELPPNRTQAWGRIAVAYSKAAEIAEAERVMSAARSFADEQMDPRTRADCLAEIGSAWHSLKDTEQSQNAFAAAEQTAGAIEDQQSRAYALLHLAQKISKAKQKAEARKLLLAAQDVALKVKDTSIRGPLVEEIDAELKKL
jgi:hypothetical protein